MKQRIQMTWILTIVLGLFLVFVLPVYAAPSVFNAGANPWPDTSIFTHPFPNIGTPTTNITLTFTGNITRFLSSPASPQTNNTITGGAGVTNTLFIGANFENTNQVITLTIDLSSHVVGASLTLMDIDTGTDQGLTLQDEVLVTGSGSVTGVVTPTFTFSSTHVTIINNNVARSTGTSVNNEENGGNVLANFGTAAINQIIIVYRPGPNSTSDPAGGGIALHEIYFTPSTPTAVSLQSFQAQTPDVVAPALFAGILFAGFTGMWAVQRRRQLKKVVKLAPIRPPHTP